MTEFKELTIKDFAEVKGGKRLPKGNFVQDEPTHHPYIRVTDFEKDRLCEDNIKYITDEIFKKIKRYIITDKDVYISIAGTIGLVGIIPKHLNNANLTENAAKICNINNLMVKHKYLMYYLRSINGQYEIQSKVVGTSQPKLALYRIEEIKIKIPSIKSQEKIVDILSNYDDLIENNNKRIKILEEMAQKIYKEWFLDFKFPGYEATIFKQTDLVKIPSDWKIVLANQIANIYIGRTPSRKDFECFTTCKQDKKWVSIKDIGHSNEYIFNTSEYLTKNAIKKYNVPLIPKDTIILSFKLTVGKVTITTEEMTSNEAIAQFQIKDKELTPTNYLFLYLKHFEYNNLGNTSSIGNAINSTIVKNIPIIVPDKGVVQKFDKTVINIFNQIKNLSQQNINLKQARDILLPRLISGEIDVENMEVL